MHLPFEPGSLTGIEEILSSPAATVKPYLARGMEIR